VGAEKKSFIHSAALQSDIHAFSYSDPSPIVPHETQSDAPEMAGADKRTPPGSNEIRGVTVFFIGGGRLLRPIVTITSFSKGLLLLKC
jgi:hypothetical protein